MVYMQSPGLSNLEKLIAIDEIRQLKARYFRLMDMRDFNQMGHVFCRDAVFDCSEGSGFLAADGSWKGAIGPIVAGREAIMSWITDAFRTCTSVHHGHCHEVLVDSDVDAHGIIAMEDYIRALDRETKLLHGAGHYTERYRFEEGGWRIAETKLTRLFLGP